jgi:hypothetical protein
MKIIPVEDNPGDARLTKLYAFRQAAQRQGIQNA